MTLARRPGAAARRRARTPGQAPGLSPRRAGAGTAPAAVRTGRVRPSRSSTLGREADPVAADAASRQWKSNLTGRAAVLALVLCALALALAYPLREFIATRAEIAGLHQQSAAAQQRVAALQAQQNQWKDPAFVKTQARERLHFVMPGEIGYILLDPSHARPAAAAGAGTAVALRPWYSDLWASVQAADRPVPPARRAP